METYRLDIIGYDAVLEFDGEDDGAAVSVALSARSPLGHALSRGGRFLAWVEPSDSPLLVDAAVDDLGH
jgi:hypothetical protein